MASFEHHLLSAFLGEVLIMLPLCPKLLSSELSSEENHLHHLYIHGPQSQHLGFRGGNVLIQWAMKPFKVLDMLTVEVTDLSLKL